jgi:hypothetical protein
MANAALTKILDMYKEGRINPDEAEKMLASVGSTGTKEIPQKNVLSGSSGEIDWPDDGKLRIVAFIGRRLLKKGDP